MERLQKIALIRSVVKVWGDFPPSAVDENFGLSVGELGRLIALIDFLSLDCIEVSIYDTTSSSSSSLVDYTIPYSELEDSVLDELVLLSRKYNEVMLEQEQE
jgi:hypothetical protein